MTATGLSELFHLASAKPAYSNPLIFAVEASLKSSLALQGKSAYTPGQSLVRETVDLKGARVAGIAFGGQTP